MKCLALATIRVHPRFLVGSVLLIFQFSVLCPDLKRILGSINGELKLFHRKKPFKLKRKKNTIKMLPKWNTFYY